MILVTTIDQPPIIGWPGSVYTALTSQCTLAAATECAAPSQSRDQLSLSSAPASGETETRDCSSEILKRCPGPDHLYPALDNIVAS